MSIILIYFLLYFSLSFSWEMHCHVAAVQLRSEHVQRHHHRRDRVHALHGAPAFCKGLTEFSLLTGASSRVPRRRIFLAYNDRRVLYTCYYYKITRFSMILFEKMNYITVLAA